MRSRARDSATSGARRRRWGAGVVALFFLGCLSPTMPLPPPSRPTIDGPDASGLVVLSGQIDDASYVYADNLSTGYSAGQALDPGTGEYRFSIGASVGDSMSLFYRRGNDDSQAQLFKIPEPLTASGTQRESAAGGSGGVSSADVGGVNAAGGSGGASLTN